MVVISEVLKECKWSEKPDEVATSDFLIYFFVVYDFIIFYKEYKH